MKLKILGTGTAIPSLERSSSAYLVFAGDYKILIDAGPSTVRRLLEFGYTVNDIDIIMLTHFHVDHTADISTFLFACNYGMAEREKDLLIIGGQGINRFYRGLLAVYPWLLPKSYCLTIKSMPKGRAEIGDICVETDRVRHNRESIGIRIARNGSITFSGDTDYSKNLVSLARHTDLLIADCAFPEKKVKGHMNLNTLSRVVDEAEPRRVILSHLYPDWKAFKGVLHLPYLMGEDGLETEI
ncbi:MAG: hypothetical protein C0392_12695 [Syntrophus sp. (in: bacteria)]|nr:hypothetical protein [Syntrophus sp. (in: bacteria)]